MKPINVGLIIIILVAFSFWENLKLFDPVFKEK